MLPLRTDNPGPVRPVGQDECVTEQSVAPVHESWRRIEEWLGLHAPASLEYLNPPAGSDEIDAVERTLGTPLPPELVQSLSCHDGMRRWSGLLPEQTLLAADTIAQRWQMCMEIAAENDGLEPQPWEDEPWWHPLWIPWAESADGVYQVIDLRAGAGRGRLGWAGHSDGGDFTDAWPNLSALLHAVAEALCRGGSVQGLHPYLTGDGEVWWDAADRCELNGLPLLPLRPHRL